MNSLIQQEINELIPNDFLDNLKKLELLEAQIKQVKAEIEPKLKEAMRNNGIKSLDCEGLRITYKEPSTRKVVDTQKLKDEGIYDKYLKISSVSDSVIIKVKYDE